MSEQLTPPDFADIQSAGDSLIKIKRGALPEGAVAWDLRYAVSGGSDWSVVHLGETAVSYMISGLAANTAYIVQLASVGDGVDYTTSDWSDSVSATTLTARTGKIYTWDADVVFSKSGKKAQDVMFRAKVTDLDTEEPIATSNIEEIRLTVRKINGSSISSSTEIVEGYDGILIPFPSFSAPDAEGYNFKYIPDQRVFPVFGEAGRYEAQVDVAVTDDNPIQILYQDIIVT